MYMERVINEIKKLGTPNPRKFVPCTEEEIVQLEKVTHFTLPQAYREWLRTMGKHADTFLRGSDWLYPELVSLQEVAPKILVRDHFPLALPEDAFVFFMHQGYQFQFFRTSEGDDPPVYRYVEEDDREETAFPFVAPHFTDLLIDILRIEADIKRQLRQRS